MLKARKICRYSVNKVLPGNLFFLPGLFVLLAILCSSRICEIFNGMMEVDIVCFSWMLSRVSTRQTVFVAFFNRKSHVLHVLRLATLFLFFGGLICARRRIATYVLAASNHGMKTRLLRWLRSSHNAMDRSRPRLRNFQGSICHVFDFAQ